VLNNTVNKDLANSSVHFSATNYAHFSSVTPTWTGINWHLYSVSFAGMFNVALFYRRRTL